MQEPRYRTQVAEHPRESGGLPRRREFGGTGLQVTITSAPDYTMP